MHSITVRVFCAAAFLAAAISVQAQTLERRAIMKGNPRDHGKCTIEVRVDDAAEVEIRGDTAYLRTLSGRPAEWRRFECNQVMPPNPAEFRFSGIDGRGYQALASEPRNGRPAVVRIEDRDGGSEGYTFDIEWNGNYESRGDSRDRGGFGPPPPPYGDRRGRLSADEAIRVCEDAVVDRTASRFGRERIEFRRADLDGRRRDWVIGTFEVRRGRSIEAHQFSCAVDFERGRVGDVRID